MIYAKEIYQWLKATYQASDTISELGVKQVGIGPSAIIPGPTSQAGGVAQLFPIVHIAEASGGNSWDTQEQIIRQTYGVRIKYYRILGAKEELLQVMSTELAKLAAVLKAAMGLDYLGNAEFSPERIRFDGSFQVFDEGESMIWQETGSVVAVGWFDISISLNHII